MAYNEPATGFLPPFLDPLLDRLAESLPPTLYDAAVGFLSHSFAAITAIFRLCTSLLNRNPSEWTAEALLPPIITVLAAYLALASLYRTASWAIRLMLFFLKWGSLIGIVMALAGYIAGNGGNAVGNQHAGQPLGGVLSSLLGGDSTSRRSRRTSPRHAAPQSRTNAQSQQGWQYQQGEGDAPRGNAEAQQLMDAIVGAANNAFKGDWWGVVSSLGQDHAPNDGKTRKEGKARVGKSRSR